MIFFEKPMGTESPGRPKWGSGPKQTLRAPTKSLN